MAVTFASPYLPVDVACRWLRGNHHGHSTLSDGTQTPAALLRAYEEAGYHYLALSEHDLFADPGDYVGQTDLVLLPAVEVTSVDGQTLMHLGASEALPAQQLTARQIMDAAHADGGFFVFDHPNWQPRPDYATDGLLDTLNGLRGMEIYCGVIERLTGEARAADRWDRLLTAGWQVWGHATDDQHTASDRFVAWNCVQASAGEGLDATQIITALATGRFYASTGVRIDRVGAEGDRVLAQSDADEVRWGANGGRIVDKQPGGATVAWSQPFRLEAT